MAIQGKSADVSLGLYRRLAQTSNHMLAIARKAETPAIAPGIVMCA